jgi:hypothetical protein
MCGCTTSGSDDLLFPILPIFSGSARQYETRVAELVLEVACPLGVLECPLE